MTTKPTDTQRLIARLRAFANELEALQDDFPHLSWHTAFQSTSLWNGSRKDSRGNRDIKFDPNNIGKATHVGTPRDGISASVELQNLSSGIPVLYIQNLRLCTLDHVYNQICKTVALLPEHLHSILQQMTRIRAAASEKKRERKAQLLRELEELEQ